MKGILYKSKKDGWMVKYTTYKTIPGIKGVIGSHSRLPESNYLPVHPDHILHYIKDGDEFTTVDFEIVTEHDFPLSSDMFRYAKLINEEKSTKRSKQKKFTNIMEHNSVEKVYTQEYSNKLKEMSLNDAVEYLKQNPKESVKVTLSEDERSKQNI